MRGMDYGRYMAKPVLDGGHFVYANLFAKLTGLDYEYEFGMSSKQK